MHFNKWIKATEININFIQQQELITHFHNINISNEIKLKAANTYQQNKILKILNANSVDMNIWFLKEYVLHLER